MPRNSISSTLPFRIVSCEYNSGLIFCQFFKEMIKTIIQRSDSMLQVISLSFYLQKSTQYSWPYLYNKADRTNILFIQVFFQFISVLFYNVLKIYKSYTADSKSIHFFLYSEEFLCLILFSNYFSLTFLQKSSYSLYKHLNTQIHIKFICKMKFAAVVFGYLLGSAVTQYTVSTKEAVLPTTPEVNTYVPKAPQTIAVPTFPNAEVLKLTLGSTDGATTQQNIVNTIGDASRQFSIPVRSFESLFTRHPTRSQLDKFANDGDTAAISRTLQNLAADDSVPCQVKVSYLLQVLSSIKGEIARKNLASDQLQGIIDRAKAEISRLNEQINRVQKARQALNLPGLQTRVNDIVTKLYDLYRKINAVRAQIPPEEARIRAIQRQIAALSLQNDQERNKISNDRLRLAQTTNQILAIQARIRQAKDQKAALEASIAASDSIIKENNQKISNIRNTIADIRQKIRKLQDSLNRLDRDAQALRVDEQRSRSDLSIAEATDKTLLAELRSYQDRVNQQQPKLVDDQLTKVRGLIANLNKSLPEVQSEIDRQYYYCYGGGAVVQKVGSVIVYVVKGQSFGHYLQTAYGQSVQAPQVDTRIDYRLQVVDPYSKIWTAKYGYPWVTGGKGDFSCYRNSSNTGSGLITGINNNGITVTDANGKSVKLTIGSCSRIESTEALPRVGHRISWKGNQADDGSVETSQCTAWSK